MEGNKYPTSNYSRYSVPHNWRGRGGEGEHGEALVKFKVQSQRFPKRPRLNFWTIGHSRFPFPPHTCLIITFSSVQFSSVAQSCPTLCDPMNCSTPGLCPSSTPGVHSNSCPNSAISSSVIPFSSCPQSLPASGSFPMS